MNSIRQCTSPKKEVIDHSLMTAVVIACLLLSLLIVSNKFGEKNLTETHFGEVITSQQDKQKFIARLRLQIAKVNRKIKYQQALLSSLEKRISNHSFHRNRDTKKLHQLYREYGLQDMSSNVKPEINRHLLKERMQTVSSGLIIAMAAVESNWGQSPISEKLNNYFIKTCSVNRCSDLKRLKSKSDKIKTTQVQKFSNIDESLSKLVGAINTHSDFKVFRNTRAGFIRRGQLYSSQQLARSLSYTSIYNEDELFRVNEIITTYKL